MVLFAKNNIKINKKAWQINKKSVNYIRITDIAYKISVTNQKVTEFFMPKTI